MSYILSSKVLEGINVEKIFSEISDGYLQITPKIIKSTVINLGMTKGELIEIANLRTNLKVYNKDFSEEKLQTGDFDVLILSNGKMDYNELPAVANKIKNMIGQTTMIGIGLGKHIIELALEQLKEDSGFVKHLEVMKHKKFDIYYCENNAEGLKEVFKKI